MARPVDEAGSKRGEVGRAESLFVRLRREGDLVAAAEESERFIFRRGEEDVPRGEGGMGCRDGNEAGMEMDRILAEMRASES